MWTVLTNAMGAIRCLVFDCWIPPEVHMDNVISGGEIQPRTTRLGTD